MTPAGSLRPRGQARGDKLWAWPPSSPPRADKPSSLASLQVALRQQLKMVWLVATGMRESRNAQGAWAQPLQHWEPLPTFQPPQELDTGASSHHGQEHQPH